MTYDASLFFDGTLWFCGTKAQFLASTYRPVSMSMQPAKQSLRLRGRGLLWAKPKRRGILSCQPSYVLYSVPTHFYSWNRRLSRVSVSITVRVNKTRTQVCTTLSSGYIKLSHALWPSISLNDPLSITAIGWRRDDLPLSWQRLWDWVNLWINFKRAWCNRVTVNHRSRIRVLRFFSFLKI